MRPDEDRLMLDDLKAVLEEEEKERVASTTTSRTTVLSDADLAMLLDRSPKAFTKSFSSIKESPAGSFKVV